MRAKRLVAGALAGVTTLTVIGGCAGQQLQALEPKLELRNAAQQLADAQQAGFTLTLTGSVDDVVAAARTTGDQPTGDDLDVLRKVFHSSITMAYDKAGAGPEDDRSSIAASVDGLAGTEVRFVGGVVYLRAPVTELATRFGADAAEVAELRKKAVAEVPELATVFDGEWVSADVTALTDAASQFALGTGPRERDEQRLMAEVTTSATNLLDGAEVVRDSADSTHLIVTSSTTKAYAEAKRLATTVEQALGEDFAKAPADRPIVLDLWIDNGRLTAAEINLLQFVDGATGRVAARIEVTTGAPIEAPSGARAIDVKGLLSGISAASQPAVPGLLGPDNIAVPEPASTS